MSIIPDHAKVAFSGVLSRTWQWEQELFDGSTATFESVERQNTAQVLAIQGDTILVAYQKQPQYPHRYFDFLGGRVPFDTDILEHAKVELCEEAGMIAHERELLRDWTKGGYMKRDVHTYIARDLEIVGEQELDPGGEILEVKALDFSTMIDMIIQKKLGNVYIRAQVLEMKLANQLDVLKKRLFGLS